MDGNFRGITAGVDKDTRGQRLEQMSALSGYQFVVYRIAKRSQLTSSLGEEIAFLARGSFSKE